MMNLENVKNEINDYDYERIPLSVISLNLKNDEYKKLFIEVLKEERLKLIENGISVGDDEDHYINNKLELYNNDKSENEQIDEYIHYKEEQAILTDFTLTVLDDDLTINKIVIADIKLDFLLNANSDKKIISITRDDFNISYNPILSGISNEQSIIFNDTNSLKENEKFLTEEECIEFYKSQQTTKNKKNNEITLILENLINKKEFSKKDAELILEETINNKQKLIQLISEFIKSDKIVNEEFLNKLNLIKSNEEKVTIINTNLINKIKDILFINGSDEDKLKFNKLTNAEFKIAKTKGENKIKEDKEAKNNTK